MLENITSELLVLGFLTLIEKLKAITDKPTPECIPEPPEGVDIDYDSWCVYWKRFNQHSEAN